MIREVNAQTGDITTIAGNGTPGYSGDGGPATAAVLNSPEGVAVDASGDLFIADSGNDVIREVNLTTGTITTVAGTWQHRLQRRRRPGGRGSARKPRRHRGRFRREALHQRQRGQRDPRDLDADEPGSDDLRSPRPLQ